MNTPNTKILLSKENRSTKIALGIAIILIIVLYLILSANPEDPEATNYNGYVALAIISGAIYYYTKRKTKILTDDEVIEQVYQNMYRNSGTHINKIFTNVKVVKSGVPGERYVQLDVPRITFLWQNGTGFVGRHPGLSIIQVMDEHNDNELAISEGKMKLKEDAMYRRLNDMGALPEEVDE